AESFVLTRRCLRRNIPSRRDVPYGIAGKATRLGATRCRRRDPWRATDASKLGDSVRRRGWCHRRPCEGLALFQPAEFQDCGGAIGGFWISRLAKAGANSAQLT